MKDNLGRYCPKTFEMAKGKKEKGCRQELNQGPPTAHSFSPDGTNFLSVYTCVVCVCVRACIYASSDAFLVDIFAISPHHLIITVVHLLMLLNWLSCIELSCTASRFPFNVPPPSSPVGLCCSA